MPRITHRGDSSLPRVRFDSRDDAARALVDLLLRFLRSPKLMDHLKIQVQSYTALIRVLEYDRRHRDAPILDDNALVAAFADDFTLELKELEETYGFMRAVLADYLGERGAELSPGDVMGLMNKMLKDRHESVYDRVYKLVVKGMRLTEAIREVDPEYDLLKGYDRSAKLRKYHKGVKYSSEKFGKPVSSSPRRSRRQ
ncbi:MAG: hypothetical protein LC114_01180 [Bryobacterales bacterium]|nr:hypothetical protein [Bryobacterales bacterium]